MRTMLRPERQQECVGKQPALTNMRRGSVRGRGCIFFHSSRRAATIKPSPLPDGVLQSSNHHPTYSFVRRGICSGAMRSASLQIVV